MPLASASLTGDPILEKCFTGLERMQFPDNSLSVKRLQAGLIAIGRSVGPSGDDGIFGSQTATAIVNYKTFKGLMPNDPVVGPGTSNALDQDLFFDPPLLDPHFAEFSGHVVSHRVEQFVALELANLLAAPANSLRHMLGNFALSSLSSGHLLGITAKSRALQLQVPYLAVADAQQFHHLLGIISAAQFFDEAIAMGGAVAVTETFTVLGVPRAFILIDDSAILGRAEITQLSTGKKAKQSLQSVTVHELVHARNIAGAIFLLSISDTDAATYTDTAAAVAATAVGPSMADTLRSFVHEMTARHIEWAIRQEVAGTPGAIAIASLGAANLAAAAWFYFNDTGMFNRNGYITAIKGQGIAKVYDQLAKWLELCTTQTFSDNPAEEQAATAAFLAAAQFCAARATNPAPLIDPPSGLYPLPQDFI